MIHPYSPEEMELLAQAFALGIPVSISRSPEGWATLRGQIEAVRRLQGFAQEPAHLRDDAPFTQCPVCGRKSWSSESPSQVCGMPQPDGHRCQGVFPALRAP